MTELLLKNKIERKKLDSIVWFLKAWGIDAEIKTTPVEYKSKVNKKVTFTDFGIVLPEDYIFNREEANAR